MPPHLTFATKHTSVRYYVLEPEVAGGLGANTEVDTTCHPPKISRLHYAFEGWLGDCLVESFPCFVATESAINELKLVGISGMADSDVEVSTTDEFRERHPDRDIGRWRWLRPIGDPGVDDLATTASARMVASERVVQVLRRHGLEHCDINEYQKGEQG